MKRLRKICAAGALGLLSVVAMAGAAMSGPAVAAEQENSLQRFLKAAPKAPDAWCQRHAFNGVAAQWRASRDGATGAAAPSADAGSAASCNPVYSKRLSACALAPAGMSAQDDTEGRLSARIRDCMATLASEGIKPTP